MTAAPAPQRTLVVVTDEPGWHGRELHRAFGAWGYRALNVSLTDCHLSLEGDSAGIRLPGLDGALPAGVFVRGVPGGSLEQVIARLDILHALQTLGVVVYNSPRAIERTVDKSMTSFLLKHAGLPSPDTWVCESREQARAQLHRAIARGRPLVLKPVFGSQGEGLRLLRRARDLPAEDEVNGLYYLQEYIAPPGETWQDWRVFVIHGRAVTAMRRHSRHWITNRAQGASCEQVPLDAQMTRLAEAAVRAVDIEYAGVDLLRDADGRFLITEVNSIPAWMGLQRATGIRMAELLAEDFITRLGGISHAGLELMS